MIIFYIIITVLFFTASVFISIYSLEQFYLFLSSTKKRPVLPPILPLTVFPQVTIQLAIYNERFVVKNLIDCILRLDYPAEKLEIQLLDDSTDETTKIIQSILQERTDEKFRIIHIHRSNREGYKAGALKNGLKTANGEFIAMFDADFRPQPDFLLKTLPSFADQKIAAVQTRWGHINEDQSLITKVQGILINNHFLVEQKGRYDGDMLLQFSGTGGVWRKKAIEEAGGWRADTIVEDVDLSFRAQLAGWKIKLLSDVVCPAELPADINALKVQQFRWMQGGAEVCRLHLMNIWKSDLNFKQKFHASLHLTTVYIYFSIFLSAILSLPMLYAIPALKLNPIWLGILSMGLLLIVIVLFLPNYQTGWIHLSKKQRINRFILLFPSIVVSGLAISFHNSVAIWKGAFSLSTPFHRTPKFNAGDRKKLSGTVPTSYRIKASWIAWVELILVFYFTLALFLGISSKNYVFVVYHFVLILVFATISFLSLGLNQRGAKNGIANEDFSQ